MKNTWIIYDIPDEVIKKITYRMKALFIGLFICIIQLSAATAYSQSVKLNLKTNSEINLIDLFGEIEKHSGLMFNYKNEDVEHVSSVIKKNEGMVEEVLDQALANTNLTYAMEGKHVTIIKKSEAKQVKQANKKRVSGVVLDGDDPLIGVTVSLKGETIGTFTDIDGRFSLDVPATGAVLKFSYIGYISQEIAILQNTSLEVKLEKSQTDLDEVIVVGFGSQKKVNLTGAVGVIDAQAFESVPVQNAVQALQGQLPGLNISSDHGGGLNQRQAINIRGIGTIGEGSTGSALVLIDGMEGDIYTLNPQDIESISVLKDAAASSIYGSRAPFGVVLVTTKKGKEGRTEINYNNSFRFSSPINMPHSLDSYTFALYYNDAAENSGWGPYNWVSEERMQRIKDYMSGKLTETTIRNPSNPALWGDGYAFANDNVDYYDFFFKKRVPSQEHNLSIRGGSKDIQYYLSTNYLTEDGNLRVGKDKSNRYTVSSKIDGRLSKMVSISYNMRFVRNDFQQPTHLDKNFFGDIGRQAWPTKPLYDPNGNLFDDHVLLMDRGGTNKERNTWVYQQGQIVVNPIQDLRLVGDINYRYNTQSRHADYQTVHQLGVDGKTKGTEWNRDSRVNESSYSSDYFNVNLYTDYTKTFAESHNFKVMGGFQAEQNNYKNIYADKIGIIYPGKPTIDTSNGLDHQGNKVPPGVAGGHNRWSTAGFFGRINYDYKGKYLLETNLRYDGSSRFRRDNRWGLFPSISTGWNIAREDFFKPIERTVNTVKVRASYGSLGNQNTTSLYPTYSVMGTGTGRWIIDGLAGNIAWPPSLVSHDLSWEKIKTWNIGLDVGFFNNRLTGSFDYFIRNTNDMVGPSEKLPVILGTAVPSSNNTDLKTQGYEIEFMWRDALKFGLNYSIRTSLSDSRTKITKYSNPSGLIDNFYAGKKLGEIWGYTTVGIAQSNEQMDQHLGSLTNGGQSQLGHDWQAGDIMYKDINNDGKIDAGSRTLDNHGDLKVIGNSTPRYNLGIELAGDWKGIDFRMFWQGTLKRDIYQGSYYFWGANGKQGPWFSTAIKGHDDYFRNDPEHPLGMNLNSYYPRPIFSTDKNQQSQTGYLQDASYMRLKNLQLGYTLPRSLTEKMSIQKLRIYFSGENLLTITNLSDLFDPESISGGEAWGHGNVYPLSRTYAFGLSVTF